MANLEHVNLLRCDVSAWNSQRQNDPAFRPELRYADLRNINLASVDLHALDLRDAMFVESSLSWADLSGSNLEHAFFIQTELTQTSFARSMMGDTKFEGVDLSLAIGLDSVIHKRKSEVTDSTLLSSRLAIPECFLVGAEVPQSLLATVKMYLDRIKISSFKSCFISYSVTDEEFVRLLEIRLRHRGVECWLDAHQIGPGDELKSQVISGIERQDIFLLCSSRAALSRSWVQKEVGIALAKQQRIAKDNTNQSLLVLDLDGYIHSEAPQSSFAQSIRQWRMVDFKDWMLDGRKFNDQFEKLLQKLSCAKDSKFS